MAAARARAEVIAALVQYLRWRRVMRGTAGWRFQHKEPPGARRNEKPEAGRGRRLDYGPRDGHYILCHPVSLVVSAHHRLLLHVSGFITTLTA